MKDIKNFEGRYAITSCGKVWSYKNKKFLKPMKNNKGYLYVNLYKDGSQKHFLVHRLVAEAYVPNPDGLEVVDHIDSNIEHNYVGNLQWMTQGDNARKGNATKVRCVETGEVFNSLRIAAKEKGCDRKYISAACRGERETAGKYHWEVV